MTQIENSIDQQLMSAGNKGLQAKFYRVRNNKVFELFVIAVIIFSAVMIGAKTYDVSPWVLQLMVVLDWAITLIFLAEITVRFLGEPNKKSFFG